MNSCFSNPRTPPKWVQNKVDQMTDILGMQRIQVYESDTANACATIHSNIGPIIAYNPDKMARWNVHFEHAFIAVLAHEVSHQYYYHPQNGSPSKLKSWNMELEADHGAGHILNRLGHPIRDAVRLYDLPDFKNSSSTHPERKYRIQSAQNGWLGKNPLYFEEKATATSGNDILKVAGIGLLAIGLGWGLSRLLRN